MSSKGSETPREDDAESVLSTLYKRIGVRSKFFGVAFAGLSVVFLVASLYKENIVLEVDSLVAFLTAIVLLFKDPRSRVQARVLDAILLSSTQAMTELSVESGVTFSYVPGGKDVSEVVIVPSRTRSATLGISGSTSDASLPSRMTPPGRGLAELYMRESGLKQLTIDRLRVSLSSLIRENFGLASYVEIQEDTNKVTVILHDPSITCHCPEEPDRLLGYIGCTVASCIAVVTAQATGRTVLLQKCIQDLTEKEWRIPIILGPETQSEKPPAVAPTVAPPPPSQPPLLQSPRSQQER